MRATQATAVGSVPMATAVAVVVQGIPMMIAPPSNIDAVPLIDANTAGMLAAVNNFTIKQRIRWGEAITGGCIEQSNVYDVFNSDNGDHIMVAVEKSDDCPRCCCAPMHSLLVEYKTVYGMDARSMSKDQLAALPTTMTMERPGCCNEKPGLCCCLLSPSCADGAVVHAGSLNGATPGTVLHQGQSIMGFIEQPAPFGGYFTPTVNIMDRGQGEKTYRPLAKVEGPCIFGGCSELCCPSSFPVSSMQPDQLNTQLKTGDLAEITKKAPQGLAQAAREALTDSDTYTLQFKDNKLAPQQKAMMLSSLVLVDYMFFEQDNGMCSCENNKLKITLFECYCLGCLCPCNIVFDGNSGGGGTPTKSEEIAR